MTIALLTLTALNTVGISVLLYKTFGVTAPTRTAAPSDSTITLNSDTEGLA